MILGLQPLLASEYTHEIRKDVFAIRDSLNSTEVNLEPLIDKLGLDLFDLRDIFNQKGSEFKVLVENWFRTNAILLLDSLDKMITLIKTEKLPSLAGKIKLFEEESEAMTHLQVLVKLIQDYSKVVADKMFHSTIAGWLKPDAKDIELIIRSGEPETVKIENKAEILKLLFAPTQ